MTSSVSVIYNNIIIFHQQNLKGTGKDLEFLEFVDSIAVNQEDLGPLLLVNGVKEHVLNKQNLIS